MNYKSLIFTNALDQTSSDSFRFWFGSVSTNNLRVKKQTHRNIISFRLIAYLMGNFGDATARIQMWR